MEIHKDGTTAGDLTAIYGIGIVAMLRGGKLTTKQKRRLERRRDAIEARGRANRNSRS